MGECAGAIPAKAATLFRLAGAYCADRLQLQSYAKRVEEKHMSKGLNQKKQTKKKPVKTMKEKKAEKREKKAVKPFAPTQGLA